MIVGGGNIGAGLARQLEKRYSVKLIERNQKRAEQLSENLEHTIVFCGDAADQELLAEEHIDQIDVFIAVTNEDEANIMSALLAKKMGAKKHHGAGIQRGALRDLVRFHPAAISPQQATISAPADPCAPGPTSLTFTACAGVLPRPSEAIAHGDENTSKVVGKRRWAKPSCRRAPRSAPP